jgi:hypothetical protein
VHVVVAGGTLWLLFGMGLMLHVAGQRRLMRVADVLCGVELVALVATTSLDVESVSTIVALVICPSLAGGFLVYCVQTALRAARDG